MCKDKLKIKNIVSLALLVFLFNFIVIKNTQAAESKSTEGSSVDINVPSEDIKKIPIIGYKLVYKKYSSSLDSFLEKEIDEFKSNLISVGVKEENIVIIFLDYYGYSVDKFDRKNQNTNKEDSSKNSNKYTTSEGIALDLSKIRQDYPIPFLATKRNILIGTLVDNNNAFSGNQDLSVTKFNIPDAKGFQYYSKESYVTQKKDISQDQNKQTKAKDPYTKEELIEQRANMIQYMNLAIFQKTNFVGMMEYHDLVNNTYAYFAIPGKLNDFLYPKDDK